jgi:hypothetical protein
MALIKDGFSENHICNNTGLTLLSTIDSKEVLYQDREKGLGLCCLTPLQHYFC